MLFFKKNKKDPFDNNIIITRDLIEIQPNKKKLPYLYIFLQGMKREQFQLVIGFFQNMITKKRIVIDSFAEHMLSILL